MSSPPLKEQEQTATRSSKRKRTKDAGVEHSSHDTSSVAQGKKKKEGNTNYESLKRLGCELRMNNCAFRSSSKLKGTTTKSGGKLMDDGKPESEIKVSDSVPSKNYDDVPIKTWILEHVGKSQGDSGKASKNYDDVPIKTWILEHVGKSQVDSGKDSGGKSKDGGKPESEFKVNGSVPSRNYANDAAIKPQEHGGKSQGESGKASGGNISKDDSAKTLGHPTEQDSQGSSPMSKGKTPQSENTLTKSSSSLKVKESGITQPKTTSSKGGEGNSIWPTEGTLLLQATQSTLRRLSRILKEGINAGVTIITSDGSLKAHKSILSTSSPVFRSMFQDDLREKVSTIEMKEMTSESCMAFLSFLYGSLNQDAFLSHQLDLLGAASKYGIVDLKDACEQSLLEDINSGNVVERLQQAWLYQLDKLKNVCFTYLLGSEKIYDMREEMNGLFKQADRGLLVEMFREVLAALKRS